MSEQLSVVTISPIFSPLTVATGVNQQSPEFAALTLELEQSYSCFKNSDLDVSEAYQSISTDSIHNRVLLWRDEEQGVEIHIFANHIAIAVMTLDFPLLTLPEDIELQSQRMTKDKIAGIYANFNNDLQQATVTAQATQLLYSENTMEDPIYWVSRMLFIDPEQLSTAPVANLLPVWLEHTYCPEDAQAILSGDKLHSLTWLNYVVVKDKQEKYPLKFDSMILAQYYYSAQERCNKLLKQAIDGAYNTLETKSFEQDLSYSRVASRLHQIDYNENLKYLSRPKKALLTEILDHWGFQELIDNSQRMIEVCSSRIDDVENNKRERGRLLTDLLLVSLSFFAVFELMLYLTELSREVMSRPALDYNDENSSFFLEYIASIDIDIMFSSGFCLTLLLVIAYKFIKEK